MKKLWLLIGITSLAGTLCAQAPYAGGAGDGYAKARLVLETAPSGGVPKVNTAVVFTAQVPQLRFQVDGLREQVRVTAYDAAGRRLWEWRRVEPGVTDEYLDLPGAAQLVLLDIEVDGHEFVRRIVIPGRGY